MMSSCSDREDTSTGGTTAIVWVPRRNAFCNSAACLLANSTTAGNPRGKPRPGAERALWLGHGKQAAGNALGRSMAAEAGAAGTADGDDGSRGQASWHPISHYGLWTLGSQCKSIVQAHR